MGIRMHQATIFVVCAVMGGAFLSSCSTTDYDAAPLTPKAKPTIVSEEPTPLPAYYGEFDPNTVDLFDPCPHLTEEFFNVVNVRVIPGDHMKEPDKGIYLCQFAIVDQRSHNTTEGRTFIFGTDTLTPEDVRERFSVLEEEGPWQISSKDLLPEHGICTASISTHRGRFTVSRTEFYTDPRIDPYLCQVAKDMAIKSADYLFNTKSIIQWSYQTSL